MIRSTSSDDGEQMNLHCPDRAGEISFLFCETAGIVPRGPTSLVPPYPVSGRFRFGSASIARSQTLAEPHYLVILTGLDGRAGAEVQDSMATGYINVASMKRIVPTVFLFQV